MHARAASCITSCRCMCTRTSWRMHACTAHAQHGMCTQMPLLVLAPADALSPAWCPLSEQQRACICGACGSYIPAGAHAAASRWSLRRNALVGPRRCHERVQHAAPVHLHGVVGRCTRFYRAAYVPQVSRWVCSKGWATLREPTSTRVLQTATLVQAALQQGGAAPAVSSAAARALAALLPVFPLGTRRSLWSIPTLPEMMARMKEPLQPFSAQSRVSGQVTPAFPSRSPCFGLSP